MRTSGLVLLIGCSRVDVPPDSVAPVPATDPVDPPAIGAAADTGAFRPPAEPPPDPTWTNPVAWGIREPHVTVHEGTYYLLSTSLDRIEVRRATTLAGLAGGERKTLWTPPAGREASVGLQGPELYRLEGAWYIYYAATDSVVFDLSFNYRLFVLRGEGDDPWDAAWSHAGELTVDGADAWSIQPTVLTLGARRYLLWSGNRSFLDFTQHLFIAELVSPTAVGDRRVLLPTPTAGWEQVGEGSPSRRRCGSGRTRSC